VTTVHIHTTGDRPGSPRVVCGPGECDLCTIVEWPARDQSPDGIAAHLGEQAARWSRKSGRLHRYDYDSDEEMAAAVEALRARARRARSLAKEAAAGAFSGPAEGTTWPPHTDETPRAADARLLAALEAIPPGADGWRRASLSQLADGSGLFFLQQVMTARDKLIKAGVIEHRVVTTQARGSTISAWRIT
jgi:hypothetical protein